MHHDDVASSSVSVAARLARCDQRHNRVLRDVISHCQRLVRRVDAHGRLDLPPPSDAVLRRVAGVWRRWRNGLGDAPTIRLVVPPAGK